MNQAWSKVKYKYRAKNVLTLIARSTALTKWVASLITWQDTLRGRVRVLTKIINIAIVRFVFQSALHFLTYSPHYIAFEKIE